MAGYIVHLEDLLTTNEQRLLDMQSAVKTAEVKLRLVQDSNDALKRAFIEVEAASEYIMEGTGNVSTFKEKLKEIKRTVLDVHDVTAPLKTTAREAPQDDFEDIDTQVNYDSNDFNMYSALKQVQRRANHYKMLWQQLKQQNTVQSEPQSSESNLLTSDLADIVAMLDRNLAALDE